MTSEVDAGSGDDYEHKHLPFMFADRDVNNYRYYRNVYASKTIIIVMVIKLMK